MSPTPKVDAVKVADFSNANHAHTGTTGGGSLAAGAISSGTFDPTRLPIATTSALGVVKQAVASADTTGTVTPVSTGGIILLSDAISAITEMRTQLNAEIAQRAQLQVDVNALKAVMRTAGELAT